MLPGDTTKGWALTRLAGKLDPDMSCVLCVALSCSHDTGSTQAHWPFPHNRVGQGYAYILTHPGMPCIFWDHFFEWGDILKNEITSLLQVRVRRWPLVLLMSMVVACWAVLGELCACQRRVGSALCQQLVAFLPAACLESVLWFWRFLRLRQLHGQALFACTIIDWQSDALCLCCCCCCCAGSQECRYRCPCQG